MDKPEQTFWPILCYLHHTNEKTEAQREIKGYSFTQWLNCATNPLPQNILC